MGKKVLVLMPDGVSLRNFAYTSFYRDGIEEGHRIVFWNSTPFDLSSLGFAQRLLAQGKLGPFTDLMKAARSRIELRLFEQREQDPIYRGYVFARANSTIKARIKSGIIQWYTWRYGSEKGLNRLRQKIKNSERQTTQYQRCKKALQQEQPDLLFCVSQRSVHSIAPVLAAQDLKIPTASFIFSWDNVPKATKVIETDYYFAWSQLMKNQLLHYHRYLTQDQIMVTGTPQFTPHYNLALIQDRAVFAKAIGIDPATTFICFSGDDRTTSPKDEWYLRDVAKAVRQLNQNGRDIKILFRRCPVDFSDRYDKVLKAYTNEIVALPPLWKKIGEGWNTVLPTLEDIHLQVNILYHSAGVINLGSSMVFDAVTHNTPCAYMNYNYLNAAAVYQKGVYVYDFVHFRSMPSREAVVWLEHPDTIDQALAQMIDHPEKTIEAAQKWFETINVPPAKEASKRLWHHINAIGS
ncbi:MAG: UDP-glycosyltransferase [Dokdonia sp.]|jgi:hypothetical protein